MTYTLGVSFSNVQMSFGLPMYFVAVAVESSRKLALREVKTKDEFQEDPEYKKNPFDLTEVEKEISRFQNLIIRSKLVRFGKRDRNKADDDISFFLNGYLRCIESTKSSNLRLSSEEPEGCFLHIPVDREGKELAIEGWKYVNHPLFKYNIKFQRKGECERILELARLRAWYENFNMVRRKSPFLNKYLTSNSDFRFLQIRKLVWNSPPIESYPNSFVGYPRMIIQTRQGMEDILISPGTHLRFFPFSRACSGVENGLDEPTCLGKSQKKPFGTLLSGGTSEQCKTCSEASRGVKCLFQKPECDGKKMSCKNRGFVSRVCHSDSCIYVTIYNDKVKVGRSLKSRIVGRLIEQCAYDGLVFYPVPWLPFADYLEEKLVELLNENKSGFQTQEVSRATERIPSEDRYSSIVSLRNGDPHQRDKLYDEIVELLNSLKCPEANYISNLENRKVNLKRNWKVCDPLDLKTDSLVDDFQFKKVEGEVTGVVGSFIILDEEVYDTTKMEGYVVGVPNNTTGSHEF